MLNIHSLKMLQLSWKNIIHKPLSTLLSIILFALGVGLVSILFLVEKQVSDNFEKNLAKIDLVIGAKGSKLQLVTSSMYHIDAPNGNISLGEARPFLNPKHPLIKKAIPLSMGDSYQNYRIVGTTPDFYELYNGEISEGKLWEHNLETTIGASVAQELNLKIGDTFEGAHGMTGDSQAGHEDHQSFKVVGVFRSTGTVLDQLILTTPQSIWQVHGQLEEHSDSTADEAHQHHHPKSLLEETDEMEITSILVQFRNINVRTLGMEGGINNNTDMLAARPAAQITRIYELMDTGSVALNILAYVIVLVSALSIFIALFVSLRERKYELALLRTMGAKPRQLFGMIVLEGLLLAVIGYVLGILLSHIGMSILANAMQEAYQYTFSGWSFLVEEFWLLIAALVIGFIAAVLPAYQAAKTDIAETLMNG